VYRPCKKEKGRGGKEEGEADGYQVSTARPHPIRERPQEATVEEKGEGKREKRKNLWEAKRKIMPFHRSIKKKRSPSISCIQVDECS